LFEKGVNSRLADALGYYYADEDLIDRAVVELYVSPDWKTVLCIYHIFLVSGQVNLDFDCWVEGVVSHHRILTKLKPSEKLKI
jgi:hypothetical protein